MKSSSGPWGAKDNFRLNTDALEKVTISHNEENSDLYVQFISTNKFSVYSFDPLSGERTPILESCEIQQNPEDATELIIRSEDQQFKVPYLTRTDGEIVFLDSEGQP